MTATHAAVRFYNPGDLAPETLECLFSGRDHVAGQILGDLRRQATSRTRQHWLVQAPRGLGKTHLVSIIYHRIKREEFFSKMYLPIRLGEAESYECYSVGTFLLRVAEKLQEELRAEGDPGYPAFKKRLCEIDAVGDDPSLVDELTDLLKEESAARKRILLVISENFDSLLGGFSKRTGKSEVKRLRALLSHEPEFLFLWTTAMSSLGAVTDSREPLYGLLHPLKLEPLDEDATADLFKRVADAVGKPERREALSTEDGLRRRVLHRLTGGSPRAIVMAFFVVEGGQGVEEIVKEMTALLDVHTAYFEARLAQCAPRERTILTALCLADTNLTMQEIAAKTRLPERSLSTQVERLLSEGHLLPAEGTAGKGALYEVADGLFRLWYQYRKGRALLEPIVRFLALWHQPEDLKTASRSLAQEAQDENLPLLQRDFARKALAHVEEALRLATSPAFAKERKELWRGPESARGADPTLVTADERFRTSFEMAKKGQLREACEGFDDVIGSLGSRKDAETTKRIAFALFNKGVTLGKLNRVDEELAAYEEIVKRFAERPEPAILQLVGRALFNWGATLERADQALAVYDELIKRFSERAEPAFLELVARALVGKGLALRALDRADEGIGAYDEVVRRLAGRPEPAFLELVSAALFNKGGTLGALGRRDQALGVYEELIQRFSERPESAFQELVARAFFNRGVTLGGLGRADEAVAVHDELVRRFSERSEATFLELVGSALAYKGNLLGARGRFEEALAVHDDVVRRFSGRTESSLVELVARVRHARAFALSALGHADEAQAAFDELLRSLAERSELALLEIVSAALVNKGKVLAGRGRVVEALEAINEAIHRFADRPEPGLREQVANGLWVKGGILVGQGRVDDGIAALQEIGRRFPALSSPLLADVVGKARLELALVLARKGRTAESEQARALWIDHIRAPGRVDELVNGLRRMTSMLPLKMLREWLSVLCNSGLSDDLVELVRLHRLVADVLEASEPRQTGGRKEPGPSDRRKRALARVPPAFRQTVRELADLIAVERKQLRVQTAR